MRCLFQKRRHRLSRRPGGDSQLSRRKTGYFGRSGGFSLLDLAILRAYVSVDNLGYYCGTGPYEEARPGPVKAGILLGYLLAVRAAIQGDSEAAWLLRRFRGTQVGT